MSVQIKWDEGWRFGATLSYGGDGEQANTITLAGNLVICNDRCYIVFMIKSFRDTWLKNFFIDGVKNKKIPPIIAERLFRKLQILDDSTYDIDLRSPPSNNFEKLTGKLKDWHSIRANEQWRLIFQWDNDRGAADNVYLDNHSYR